MSNEKSSTAIDVEKKKANLSNALGLMTQKVLFMQQIK